MPILQDSVFSAKGWNLLKSTDFSRALVLEGVCRSYGTGGSRHEAVRDLSLEVAPGEVVALLGPNGAGKTTTVNVASPLLRPDSGRVTVCGVDAVAQPKRACARLSLLLGGSLGFYTRARAADNLRFFAMLAGVAPSEVERRIMGALESVELADHANDRVQTFSRGMLQRLHIARALVPSPGLILLDEPTTSLDPESAAQVRDIIEGLRSSGMGILLTTHIMAEAEQLADSVNIMESGSIVASGTVLELASSVRLASVTSFNAASMDHDVVASLEAMPQVRMINVTEKVGSWDIDVGWGCEVPSCLPEGVAAWSRVGDRPATLEEVYLSILRQARAGKADDGE